jgi:hypothetical protein
MCQEFRQTGRCSSGKTCQFAHSRDELRSTANVFKTKMCKFYVTTGSCSLGSGCRFAHGHDELRAADYFNPNRDDSLSVVSAVFPSPPDTPTSTVATDDSLLLSATSATLVPTESEEATAADQGGGLMQFWNSGRRLSAVAAELQKLFFPSQSV